MRIIRAVLLGYGKMGQQLEQLAPDYGYEIVGRYSRQQRFDPKQCEEFELAFDFSHPDVVEYHVRSVAELRRSIVIGTTGWYDRLAMVQQLAQQAQIGVLYGRNFSVGMQVFFRIVRTAAQLMNTIEEYDVFMQEIHHRAKIDSPSGTAQQLAELLLAMLDRKSELLSGMPTAAVASHQLHLAVLRGGAVPGEHTVYFDSEFDTLMLTHRARNRKGFAIGALLGGRWIVDRSGCYDFSEVFEKIVR